MKGRVTIVHIQCRCSWFLTETPPLIFLFESIQMKINARKKPTAHSKRHIFIWFAHSSHGWSVAAFPKGIVARLHSEVDSAS